mmetsp:Transcript_23818/g.50648  ORF Transcript_23818/g.50648 Transcript_23818/m.50648 type:complete len:86 (-) Transcript_23818:18-275(-)
MAVEARFGTMPFGKESDSVMASLLDSGQMSAPLPYASLKMAVEEADGVVLVVVGKDVIEFVVVGVGVVARIGGSLPTFVIEGRRP